MSRNGADSSGAGAPPNEPATQDGFVSRWEQRKQRVREESQNLDDGLLNVQEEAAPAVSENDSTTTLNDESTAEAVVELTDADMPPIESLGEASDYSGFMSPKVSDELRRLALRKLFQAASFNVCDGLDDYDEDFTQFEKLGDIVTSDMKHQWEVEARKRAEAALADEEQTETPTLDQEPVEELDAQEPLVVDDEKAAPLNDDEQIGNSAANIEQQGVVDTTDTHTSPERNPNDVA